ncbi:MAG: DUF2167 domain-containing protein [Cytophagales bacterium]|nr:MAG: DUF2167 domain-containing protein [Cytophagales bacterium]TAF61929.1 MAG: DUF2167 domain-containing protein [Cytophagales bacterium]
MIKIVSTTACLVFLSTFCVSYLLFDNLKAQDEEKTIDSLSLDNEKARLEKLRDSLNRNFKFRVGKISILGGIIELNVPPHYKYLDATQSQELHTRIWNNQGTRSPGAGILFKANFDPVDPNVWATEISYEKVGHVEDTDASDLEKSDLLRQIRDDIHELNEQRAKNGLPEIELVGWAEKPRYDPSTHTLYWAQELKFSSDDSNVLNYNMRVLGRNGVLNLNIVGNMADFEEIKHEAELIRRSFKFQPGHRYEDFDSNIDEIAVMSVAGLVAGKLIAKFGVWILFVKLWKWLAAGLLASLPFLRKYFKKN